MSRNVEALSELIGDWMGEMGEWPMARDLLARFLAARGVLVPSALTDEDLERIASRLDSMALPDPGAVALLERIAKGETA